MIGGYSDALKRLSFFQRILVGMGRLVGATRDPAAVRKFSKLWMPMGKRVTIIGGSLVGLELADFFSERNRSVTVLEGGAMAPQMAIPRRWRVLHHLRERGVSLLGNVEVMEILADGVAFTTRKAIPVPTSSAAPPIRKCEPSRTSNTNECVYSSIGISVLTIKKPAYFPKIL